MSRVQIMNWRRTAWLQLCPWFHLCCGARETSWTKKTQPGALAPGWGFGVVVISGGVCRRPSWTKKLNQVGSYCPLGWVFFVQLGSRVPHPDHAVILIQLLPKLVSPTVLPWLVLEICHRSIFQRLVENVRWKKRWLTTQIKYFVNKATFVFLNYIFDDCKKPVQYYFYLYIATFSSTVA